MPSSRVFGNGHAGKHTTKGRSLDSKEILGPPSRMELDFLRCLAAGERQSQVTVMATNTPAGYRSGDTSKSKVRPNAYDPLWKAYFAKRRSLSKGIKGFTSLILQAPSPPPSHRHPRLFMRRQKGLSCVSWKLSRTVLRGRDRSNPVLSLDKIRKQAAKQK